MSGLASPSGSRRAGIAGSFLAPAAWGPVVLRHRIAGEEDQSPVAAIGSTYPKRGEKCFGSAVVKGFAGCIFPRWPPVFSYQHLQLLRIRDNLLRLCCSGVCAPRRPGRMAEFVGIDPAGVRRLITSMDDAVQRAQTLRPSLSASIAEAGTRQRRAGRRGARRCRALPRRDAARSDLADPDDRARRGRRLTRGPQDGGVRVRRRDGGQDRRDPRGNQPWRHGRHPEGPQRPELGKGQGALREGQGKTVDAAYWQDC